MDGKNVNNKLMFLKVNVEKKPKEIILISKV